jgi:hypothetical protein
MDITLSLDIHDDYRTTRTIHDDYRTTRTCTIHVVPHDLHDEQIVLEKVKHSTASCIAKMYRACGRDFPHTRTSHGEAKQYPNNPRLV